MSEECVSGTDCQRGCEELWTHYKFSAEVFERQAIENFAMVTRRDAEIARLHGESDDRAREGATWLTMLKMERTARLAVEGALREGIEWVEAWRETILRLGGPSASACAGGMSAWLVQARTALKALATPEPG